jgi:hypothetical protein
MPKISNVYAGDYVQAAQLPDGQRVVAMIGAATLEEVGQERDQKVVLALRATDGRPWPKGLVLNKTNALILSAAYGDDTTPWVGQTVEIWKEPVNFQGRIVPGIRLAPHVRVAAAGGGVPAAPVPGAPGNGAIPAAPQSMQTGPNTVIALPGAGAASAGAAWTPGGDLDDAIPF